MLVAPRQKHDYHVQSRARSVSLKQSEPGELVGCKLRVEVGTYSYLKGLVRTSDFALYEISQERKTYDLTSAFHSICCVVVGHRSAMKAGKAVKKLLQ